jgi:hypothetical protein
MTARTDGARRRPHRNRRHPHLPSSGRSAERHGVGRTATIATRLRPSRPELAGAPHRRIIAPAPSSKPRSLPYAVMPGSDPPASGIGVPVQRVRLVGQREDPLGGSRVCGWSVRRAYQGRLTRPPLCRGCSSRSRSGLRRQRSAWPSPARPPTSRGRPMRRRPQHRCCEDPAPPGRPHGGAQG